MRNLHQATPEHRLKVHMYLIGFLVVSLVLIFSALYYNAQKTAIRNQKNEVLKGIAELKSEQLSNWFNDCSINADFHTNKTPYNEVVEQLLSGDKTAEVWYTSILRHLAELEKYENVYLIDLNGSIIASAYSGAAFHGGGEVDLLARVVKTGAFQFGSFHYDRHHKHNGLDVMSPIRNKNNELVACLLIKISDTDFVNPLLKSWNVFSKTGESLLFVRDGNMVRFVSELKQLKNNQLQVTVPISQTNVVAVKTVLGKAGFHDGVDYAGKKVVAYSTRIKNTPFYLVNKVEIGELYADVNKVVFYLSLVVLLAFIGLVSSLAWIFNNRKKTLFQELYKSKIALHQSKEFFGATLYSIGDAVITTDELGCVRQMNPVAESLTGWLEKDALGQTIHKVFQVVKESNRDELIDSVGVVLKAKQKMAIGNDCLLKRADGKLIPINDSIAPILDESGTLTGAVVVFSDQTDERKRHHLMAFKLTMHEFALTHSASEIIDKALEEMVLWCRGSKGFFWNTHQFSNYWCINHEFEKRNDADWGLVEHEIEEWVDSILESIKQPNRPLFYLESSRLLIPVIRNKILVGVFGLSSEDGTFEESEAATVVQMADVVWEIKEIAQKEELVRISEAKYRSLVDQMQLGLALHEMIFDESGMPIDYRFLEVNPGFEAMTGLKREDVIGKTLFEALPKSEKFWIEKYAHVVSTGQLLRFENYSKEIGKYYSVIAYKSGANQFAVIIEDVTVRRQMEEQVRESEERLRSVLQNSLDAVFLTKPDGTVLMANPAACNMLNRTEEEIVSLGRMGVVDYLDPRLSQYLDQRQKVGSYKGELFFLKKDGTRFPVEIATSLFKTSKGETMSSIIARDISDRKREESFAQIQYLVTKTSMEVNKLEELLEIVRFELSKIIDATNFHVVLYEPEANQLRRVLYYNESEGQEVWSAEHSMSGQVVKQGKTILLKGEEFNRFVLDNDIHLARKAAQCWLGVPLKNKDEVVGVMVVQSFVNPAAYDVNSARLLELIAHELVVVMQRAQMIEDLIHAKEKAEESDRLKSAFLTNVSHEIRTPMNGILGFMNLLNEPDLEVDKRELYMDIMNKSGKRLLDTINNLIEISTIESGQYILHESEVKLLDLLEYHTHFIQLDVAEKGVKLILNADPSIQEVVLLTDRHRLDSILGNLLNNALKFTAQGQIELGCSYENEQLNLYVKDSGIGIPANKLNQIFDRFVQADLNITRPYEGSGLGLSIVKAYVDMFGGTIHVESDYVLGGTTFFLTIPAKQVLSKKSAPRILPKNEVVSVGVQSTILVVEDDDSNFLYIKILLERMPYTILRAVDGLEAIQMVKEHPELALIIMDIKMPRMNGLDATRKIRAFNTSIAIFCQTAYALNEDKKNALDAGCNEFLPKPINSTKLLKLIDSYCGNRTNEQQ